MSSASSTRTRRNASPRRRSGSLPGSSGRRRDPSVPEVLEILRRPPPDRDVRNRVSPLFGVTGRHADAQPREEDVVLCQYESDGEMMISQMWQEHPPRKEW
jgi:hypothetical protein